MRTDTLHNKRLGQQGEDLAAEYLAASGYKILERNYRAGHHELDIIASLAEIIHFVEVKTRHATQFGLGEDAMHKKKIDRLLQAVNVYLGNFDVEPEWQLDLIVVEMHAKHMPNFIHYESLGQIDVN